MSILTDLISPLWRWLGGIAIVASLVGGIYTKGLLDGRAEIKRQWDAAIASDIAKANKDRTDTDRTIPLDPRPDELCGDKWNRHAC